MPGACVKVPVRLAACATSVYSCALAPRRRGIHLDAAWERVHLCTQPANVCACVIPSERLQCFLCEPKASSTHFLRISPPSSYADAQVLFTHTPIASSSNAYRQVWVDLFACLRLRVHFSNVPLGWAMAAVATSPTSPPFCLYMPPARHKEAHHIYHTEKTREECKIYFTQVQLSYNITLKL